MQTTTTAKTQKPQRRDSESRPDVDKGEAGGFRYIALSDIEALPQVRTKFTNLLELGENIRQEGLMQPIVVRPKGDGKGFIVVVGERRFRAMQLAGCTEAPAIVANVATDKIKRLQLLENIQREQLNAKDLMTAVLDLYSESQSVKQVAAELNKSPAWVSKKIATAMSMGPLTVRLLEADVKDTELLYAFAKLESLDTAKALELLPQVLAKTIGRKEIQAELKATVTPEEDKDDLGDESTGDLFKEPEAPCPAPVNVEALQKQLAIAMAALDEIRRMGQLARAKTQCREIGKIAEQALTEISHAK